MVPSAQYPDDELMDRYWVQFFSSQLRSFNLRRGVATMAYCSVGQLLPPSDFSTVHCFSNLVVAEANTALTFLLSDSPFLAWELNRLCSSHKFGIGNTSNTSTFLKCTHQHRAVSRLLSVLPLSEAATAIPRSQEGDLGPSPGPRNAMLRVSRLLISTRSKKRPTLSMVLRITNDCEKRRQRSVSS